MTKIAFAISSVFLTSAFSAQFPLNKLPPHITLEQEYGERPDWAPAGSDKYIFLDKAGGHPFEKSISTGKVRSILPPSCDDCRMWRIYYLKNGDYLMTIGDDRGSATIHIVDKNLDKPAWDSGVIAHEGVAVSRHSWQLAWTDGPNIRYGEIGYAENGTPHLDKIRVILNVDELKERDKHIAGEGEGATRYFDYHEPQNWRPPHDKELIFSRYGTSNTGKYSAEVWLWNKETDEIKNMSNRHDFYDEPEGVFPSGQYTLVESDMFLPESQHAQILDLYMMRLDGSGDDMKRLTYFADFKMPDSAVTFKANQGVISQDGNYMLFGEGHSNTNDQPGSGFGIYLFDFKKAELFKKPE
ncbi:hypothetical protein [Aestuariibacter salexigens]|uniref:hypothetical protein n=1 Tax=Aestuariibacter salexigens TaxID=226010 RepID=UPI0004276B52|nr:hypothetical protein [Aestuariibacter salexigens]